MIDAQAQGDVLPLFSGRAASVCPVLSDNMHVSELEELISLEGLSALAGLDVTSLIQGGSDPGQEAPTRPKQARKLLCGAWWGHG